MSHHAAAGSSGNGTCRVGRAIIDDEGAISSALDVGDDARDHRRLIVGGDDNAYSRRLRHHRSSRNEEKPTPDQRDADHKPYRNGSAKTRQPSAGVSANASEERIGARERGKAQGPDHRTVSAA